jgi:hypothetical protein
VVVVIIAEYEGKGDTARTMDFGLITDPLKQVPFNWREVPSMKNHTPRDDRNRRTAEDDRREARQQRHNASRTASLTGGQKNPDKPEGGKKPE